MMYYVTRNPIEGNIFSTTAMLIHSSYSKCSTVSSAVSYDMSESLTNSTKSSHKKEIQSHEAMWPHQQFTFQTM